MATPDDGNDEITFNVHVAKQMTVPDEITLTGPIDRPPSAEPQMETSRMVVPDNITLMDTLGGKNDSIGGVLRKADHERRTASLTEAGGDQANDKLTDLQNQITELNTRVTRIENRYPYVSTERNILNTFAFVTWLSLPVLFFYYYHKYMRQ